MVRIFIQHRLEGHDDDDDGDAIPVQEFAIFMTCLSLIMAATEQDNMVHIAVTSFTIRQRGCVASDTLT